MGTHKIVRGKHKSDLRERAAHPIRHSFRNCKPEVDQTEVLRLKHKEIERRSVLWKKERRGEWEAEGKWFEEEASAKRMTIPHAADR